MTVSMATQQLQLIRCGGQHCRLTARRFPVQPPAGSFCMFSPCMRGFSPGTPASSQIPHVVFLTSKDVLKGNSGIFKPRPYFWHEIRSSTHREQFGESRRPSEDI